jgi:uncharacterized protein (DUF1800 family)
MTRRCASFCLLLSACSNEPVEQSENDPNLSAARTAASRFLDQATFGARPPGPGVIDSVPHVAAIGIREALAEQLQAPPGEFEPTPPHPGPIDGSCEYPYDPKLDLGAQFFVAAMTAKDQLRLRTAFALHQILVVSEAGIRELPTCTSEKRDAMTRYLNILRSRAFGNYRDLLEAITVDPAMGTFLDMANNAAFDRGGNRLTPNENFARELLQLFTVGPTLLDEDGTERLDGNGNPQATYTETQVQAFARTLTGWTYFDPIGCPPKGRNNRPTYKEAMLACDDNHDSRAAVLLRYPGAVARTTAGGSARLHLREALDNVFEHPNLPPFVVKQLIQHLVTSNPSRAYVRRIVDVFKDDGTEAHRRGNLRVVIRAILLDPEAREVPLPQKFGRPRSPVDLIARVLRSLGTTMDLAQNPGDALNVRSAALGQYVPRPPTVFSYYAPDTPIPGDNPKDLVGPAFDVLDTATTAARANLMHEIFASERLNEAGVDYDLSALPEDTAGLVKWIDDHWLHGTMSNELRTTLTSALDHPAVGTGPLSGPRRRQLAFYLAALSPEFQIQR